VCLSFLCCNAAVLCLLALAVAVRARGCCVCLATACTIIVCASQCAVSVVFVCLLWHARVLVFTLCVINCLLILIHYFLLYAEQVG
jgi:hypothetical protein